MFELNPAIAAWRRRLGQRADLGADDLDELEDHLRESMADLQDRGLSGEEAFLVAARRLGDADALGDEFAAADSRRRRGLRMRWLAAGGAVMLVLVTYGMLAMRLTSFDEGFPDFEPPILTTTHLLHLTIQLTVLAVLGLLVWRVLSGDRAARRIQHGGPAWVVRVLAVVVFGGAALFFLLAMLVRAGAWLTSGGALAAGPIAMFATFLIPPLILLAVPLGLLLLVWWLTGRRRAD